jgi:NADH dehydrogenase
MQEIRKVLVTGADGFIGKNLVAQLKKNYELICIIKNPSYNVRGIKIIYGDVTDENVVKQAIKNVDAIVHLAAIINPFDKNIGKVNVGSTRLLISSARNSNVKKFVFISTENVLYDFHDAYSEIKRTAEQIVKMFETHLILRPTLVYGKYDRRYLERIIDIAERNKIVPVPGNGKKLFQPICVDDVVKYIENGLKYDVKGEYVLAGPSKINYDYFIQSVLRELDLKRKIIHIPIGPLKFAYNANRILKIPQITIFQPKSLEIDKTYDIKKTVKNLHHKPLSFDVGIRKTIKLLKDL